MRQPLICFSGYYRDIPSELLCHPQFRACGSGIMGQLFFARQDRLTAKLELGRFSANTDRKPWRTSTALRQLRVGLLYQSVLKGVEGDNGYPSARFQRLRYGADCGRNYLQFPIHLYTYCLKHTLFWMRVRLGGVGYRAAD